jgi:hypothetical protein
VCVCVCVCVCVYFICDCSTSFHSAFSCYSRLIISSSSSYFFFSIIAILLYMYFFHYSYLPTSGLNFWSHYFAISMHPLFVSAILILQRLHFPSTVLIFLFSQFPSYCFLLVFKDSDLSSLCISSFLFFYVLLF